MPDFARIHVSALDSPNSDYSDPFTALRSGSMVLTPDEYFHQLIEADTGGTTVELGTFATITAIAIKNRGTNYVEARWFYQVGTQTALNNNFADAATGDTVTQAGGTFLTNGALAGRYVRITASENSGENNGTFLLQTATATVLTITTADNFVVNADDDAAVMSFESRNLQRIPGATTAGQGGWLIIGGPVVPEQDLLLTANTGAVICEVLVLGT